LTTLITSLLYSIYICLLAYSLFDHGNYEKGVNYGFINFANMALLGCVIVANCKIYFQSRSFTIMYVLSILGSVVLFYVFWYILDKFEEN